MALIVLRRRWRILVACTILVPVCAVAFSLTREKEYTASASLFFRDPNLDQTLFGSALLEPGSDPVREAATNVRLVSLKAVAARTSRALGGRKSADEISDEVEAAAEGQSDVVSVSATDESATFAARLANTFAAQYIAFRRDADRAKIREAETLVQRELAGLAPSERAGREGRSLAEQARQLQILASLQTGNAELVERAEPPGSPSSPKPLRNAALGLFLGALLGAALAMLRERLDRHVRDPKEIEQAFGRPILGAIPKSPALAKKSAAFDGALPVADAEAFRMLRANLRYFNVDRSVKSVLVTSAAPGDGKSTVAWNLAAAAAGARARVLLVEADLRHRSYAWGELRQDLGLSTVLAGYCGLDEALQSIPLNRPDITPATERRLDVLTVGPLPPNPVDLIESERMRELIHESEGAYDLVVIDTPPTSVVSDAIPLVREVSGVMVVVRPGYTARGALLQLKSQLENLDAPTLGVVLNALSTDSRSYGYGYGYSHAYGHDTSANGPAEGAWDEGARRPGP